VDDVPLARRSQVWRRAVVGIVALGAVVVLILWGAFLADYPLTRDVYFTIATLHVLAEVPFLLRLL
jgi:multidrug resistance efflux pump